MRGEGASRQAQVRENERMQKDIDEVKKAVQVLDVKFDDHVHQRADHDQSVALTLQDIKNTGEQTLGQAKQTNGKIAEHEKRLNDLSPIVAGLAQERKDREAKDGFKFRFWWEWGVRLALVILGIVLVKTGVINVPLW